jgi:flagellar protein FlbD
MIEVTRLNGMPMLVNSDLIKIAEASPDTMLTLIHGEKLIVRESCAEILDKVLAYRAQLLAAVAQHTKSPGELHRLVAMISHNPDANATKASPIPTSPLIRVGLAVAPSGDNEHEPLP